METCATCKWLEKVENPYMGKCRRFPPMLLRPVGAIYPFEVDSHWPIVRQVDDYCGEHAPKTTGVDAAG